MLRGICALSALVIATAAGAGEAPNAAHKIAQKFAAPTESSQADAPKPATPKAQAPKAAAAKPAPGSSERPPLDYEMEMLRSARAERDAIAGQKADQKATVATPAVPASAPAATPVAAPAATPPALPVVAAPAPAEVPKPATAIAVQIAVPAVTVPPAPANAAPAAVPPPAVKAAEAAPAAAVPNVPAKPDVKAEAKPEAKPAEAAPVATAGPASRASILLALETGGASTKSGPSQSFDPIVCLADDCFISAGLNSDAVKLSKSDALKLKTTSEASPDSCKNKVACVFRNVAIPAGAQLQVVELGSASHDPSRTADAAPDTSCKATDGNLMCDQPIATPDFKIWVVPEETARAAGVQLIEDAVADGLPHVDVARATDK